MKKTLFLCLAAAIAGASLLFAQGADIPPELCTAAPQRYLLEVSRRALVEWVEHGRELPVPAESHPAILDAPRGVFVTLEIKGKLRGCRGTLQPRWESLVRETIRNTILACSKDPRFPAVRKSEIPSLTVTLTVVGGTGQAASVDELARLDPARYGILAARDARSAVMLPGEATSWANMLKWALKRAQIRQGESFTLYYFRGVRFSRDLCGRKASPLPRGAPERALPPGAPELKLLTVGMKVPDFTLPDLHGRAVSLRGSAGEVVILNFWAFWCDTWKEEVEKFKSLRAARPSLRFRIVSVSIDALRAEKGLEAERAGKIDFPVLLDTGGAVSKARFGVKEVPTLFLLDREGVVRFKHRGYPGNQVVAGELGQLVSGTLPRDGGRMALTFDDFPNPATAPALLDALGAYGAKATFFTLGGRARKYPDLVRRAVKEGHALGNHSYSHAAPPGADCLEDFRRCGAVLEELTGKPVALGRAPGGSRAPGVLAAFDALGLRAVPWEIESGDVTRPGPERLADLVLSRARDGRIVLFHDGVEDTAAALPFIVRELTRRGFALVPADALLDARAEKP